MRGTSDESIVVHLSPWPYGVFLVSTAVIQGSCIVYLGILARVYWLLSEPFMEYFMQLLVPGSPSAYFKRWGLVFAGIGTLHLFDLVHAIYRGLLIVQSRDSRRLRRDGSRVAVTVAWDQRSRELFARDEKNFRASTQGQCPITSARRLRQSIDALNAILTACVSKFEVFGVRSPYFHAVFLCRECLEIIAQSYQVYRSSMLVARPSINSLAVTLLVLNCWSTPWLHYVFRNHRIWSRISCVFCDGILNIGTSMVLPFLVFLPYAQAFNPDVFMYLPVEMLYVEVEFTNLVIENKSVFVTSFLDGFLKIVSNLAIYGCFRTIRSVVRLKTHRKAKRRTINGRTVMPIHFSVKSEQASSANKRRIHRLSHLLTHFLFCIVGIAVLALHVLARRRTSALEAPSGCLQTMHPWFAVNYTCAAFEFNCSQHQVDSPNATALDGLDRDTLLYIGFRNCPALRIPTSFRHFHNIIGMKVLRSTIDEWKIESSIDAHIHKHLMYLFFIRVNMSRLPDGILEPLPATLTDIEFCATNLTSLPPNLDKLWAGHMLMVFYLEFSKLNIFPDALLRMNINDISLIGNDIDSISTLSDFTQSRFVFSLDHNPLRALPNDIDESVRIGSLSLEDTQLSVLPKWVHSQVLDGVYAFNTPYCAHEEDSSVVCDVEGPFSQGRYPLQLTDMWDG